MKIIRLLIALSAVLHAGLLSVRAESSGTSVTIAVVTDLSGPAAQYGKETRIGAELLKSDLAREGKQLNVVYGDSQLKAVQGLSEIQKLLSKDDPDAFYVDFTPVAVAAAPVLKAARKLAVHLSVSTEANRINEFYFKGYLDYVQGCRDVASYWKRLGISKVAALKFNGEIGERCIEGAAAVYPGMKEFPFNWGDPMPAIAEQVKKGGFEALIFGGYEQDFVNFLQAGSRLRLTVRYGGAEGDTLTEPVKAQFAKQLEGAIGFNYAVTSEGLKARIKEVDPSNTFQLYEAALTSYLHLRQLYEAVAACPRGDVECQKQVLEKSRPDPILGFEGWEDRVAKYDMALKRFTSGSLEIVR